MSSVAAAQVLLIAGPAGAGKTTLAHHVADRLEDSGVPCATVVLRPTVDEIVERRRRRGRPNDLEQMGARRAEAEHQLGVLDEVDPASTIEATGMTLDELCAECLARLAAESRRHD